MSLSSIFRVISEWVLNLTELKAWNFRTGEREITKTSPEGIPNGIVGEILGRTRGQIPDEIPRRIYKASGEIPNDTSQHFP